MKLIDPVTSCVAPNPVVVVPVVVSVVPVVPVVPVVVSVVPQSQAVVVGVVVILINELKLLFGNKIVHWNDDMNTVIDTQLQRTFGHKLKRSKACKKLLIILASNFYK